MAQGLINPSADSITATQLAVGAKHSTSDESKFGTVTSLSPIPKAVSFNSGGITEKMNKLLTKYLCWLKFEPVETPKKPTRTMTQISSRSQATKKHLLPPISKANQGKKCLVLDLDETLVHSTFKTSGAFDFSIPLNLDKSRKTVFVAKRPNVDEFLQKMSELYEIVIFTASVSKYADPVITLLDTKKVVSHRLFREACYSFDGVYIKDLSQLGRPMSDIVILDNSPVSYRFQPENAIAVTSWFSDTCDTELNLLIPILTTLASVPDIPKALASVNYKLDLE